jgi:hypothetical protein
MNALGVATRDAAFAALPASSASPSPICITPLAPARHPRHGAGCRGARSAAPLLRFDGIERRFGALESRFTAVEARLSGIETRLSAIESRVGGVEERMGSLLAVMVRIAECLDGRAPQ